jgi:hypothetical protein
MDDRNSKERRDFLTRKTWLTEQQIQTLTEAHKTVSALASAEARLLAENLGIQPLEADSHAKRRGSGFRRLPRPPASRPPPDPAQTPFPASLSIRARGVPCPWTSFCGASSATRI